MSYGDEPSRSRRCCLTHEFITAASKSPDKIAVIHASGGATLAEEFHSRLISSDSDFHGDSSRFYDECSVSTSPPVYPGDQCFTYAQVSAAVGSLSTRIRSVLDGGDDPYLAKPLGKGGESTEQAAVMPAMSFIPNREMWTDSEDVYKPEIIGLYMPPSVEYIVSVLSVLKCGKAFLAIDPWWPKERILHIISSSNIKLIIGSRSSFGRSCGQHSDWIEETGCCMVLWFSMEHNPGERNSPVPVVWPCECGKKRLFCYLMFTSGSTGKPKGVYGTEEGLLNRLFWMQELYPLHGEENFLFKTSLSFVDHLQEFLGAILCGCTLIVPPFSKLKENPFTVTDFLEAYHVSRLITVPSLMRAILPALQSQSTRNFTSLKLLVLSGEIFPVSLWWKLSNLLPNTSILNLYGSTEVSGDCSYFDCKDLPSILDREMLTSVPIGWPISNCNIVLVGAPEMPDEGEIYVGGICVSSGYFMETTLEYTDYVKLPQSSDHSSIEHGDTVFYRTGDFARRLGSGELIFLGRKDRVVKINGQRVSLTEIEDTLRGHPHVDDVAIVFCNDIEKVSLLKAFVDTKDMEKSENMLRSIKLWLVEKLPQAMIPQCFIFLESFPMTSSGKVDYELLANHDEVHAYYGISDGESSGLLEVIKEAFCSALMTEEVSDEDDFFALGGNSIAAAHASYNLGINMSLIYEFPSPSKLERALLERIGSDSLHVRHNAATKIHLEDAKEKSLHLVNIEAPSSGKNEKHNPMYKRMKVSCDKYQAFKVEGHNMSDRYPWKNFPTIMSCSFSRCNRLMYRDNQSSVNDGYQVRLANVSTHTKGFIYEEWKVQMDSCVDASPLVVVKSPEVYVFVGSHSHKFACINAKSGSVKWEIKLDGRVECSAAIIGDFSQVVVGCYKGNIYFLDFSNGKICWTFRTGGEVKSQPIVDKKRRLIWCGSHDHNLYALDYERYRCVHTIECGGSILGSPANDELRSRLYIGSTSGLITALSIKDLPFYVLWLCKLEAPVFGSLAISCSGNVICCLVDGSVIALDLSGSTVWRTRTGGPIFAGACMSSALPSQVLVCSRSGMVHSLEVEKGETLWEYDVGYPITACAYVDENLQLVSDRLVCVCTCSGAVIVLRINLEADKEKTRQENIEVEEFARLELEGEIFSSPIMIGGIIFVGCRDDNLHCLAIESPDAK